MPGDLRHACRSLLRMPALSAVVVLSLAAGIGVNTVVFSWIQARILKPVPGAPDGASVILIEPRSGAGLYVGASWPEYEDMREQLRSFDSVFAARMAPLYLGEPGNVERLFGLLVSDNYFSALGVRPALGRFFTAEEVRAAVEPIVVLSHRVWRTRFDGSPAILGRPVRINGRDLVVIGVTPDRFQGTTSGLQFDAWMPATLGSAVAPGTREIEERGVRGYGVMARLRPGTTRRQAQAEVDAFMRQLAVTYPASNRDVGAEVLPFSMSPRGPQRMLNLALVVLQGIMLILLLAVCGNVANLMLARASARQKEIGIRLSLGARRRRIASLLLTESVLLAVAGAVLGALFAAWGTRALLILPMTGIPLRFQTDVDATALAFALGLGVLSGLIFGAVPAAHLSRIDPQQVFRNGIRSSGRSRTRHALMAVQVGLAIIVLIVAGMFVRAFLETRSTDPGFRRDGLLLVTYDVSGREVDAAFSRTLAARTIERLQKIPAIEGLAIASSVPLDIHGLPTLAFTVDGHTRADGTQEEALTNIVTPGYFAVMGIPFVAGADFIDLGNTSAPRQAIVNEAFVRRYVPSGEPVGRILRTRREYRITGVVRDSLYNAFGEPPTPIIYVSYRDVPVPRGEIHARLRTGASDTLAAEIGRAMREVDAELPVFNTRSMDQHVDTNLVFRKMPARMFSVLGPMLLVLAAVGIYAVVSYSVSLRTREIGVRLALGATANRVVGTFVGETLGVALAGGIIGWSLAYLGVAALLPAERLDVTVFAVVPLILIGVAALASWIPARRAAGVDPSIALRAE